MKPYLIKHWNKVLRHASKDAINIVELPKAPNPITSRLEKIRRFFLILLGVRLSQIERESFKDALADYWEMLEVRARIAGNIPHWVNFKWNPEQERYYVAR